MSSRSHRPLDLLTGAVLVAVAATGILAFGWPGSRDVEVPEGERPAGAPIERVRLWEGNAPEARGDAPQDQPSLLLYPAPVESATGCAVIVCPGGGYWVRAMDHEGVQVARWLNDHGISAYVLSYRTRGSGNYGPDVALLDGQRAVRWVRAHAVELAIDPARVGMIGFSAGGNLINRVAEIASPGDPASLDPIERMSSRPDFLLTVYGWVCAQNETTDIPPSPVAEKSMLPVPAASVPSFFFSTATDDLPPDSVFRQVRALRQAGVEVEFHFFGGDGPHGRSLYVGDPYTGEWRSLAINWLTRNNFLTGLARLEVAGQALLDGESPFFGWISFYPVDAPTAPAAAYFFSNASPTNPDAGKFRIPARFGLVPGRYRVEFRLLATGLEDEPTLDREYVYDRLHPDDPDPLTIEVRPGRSDFRFDFRSH